MPVKQSGLGRAELSTSSWAASVGTRRRFQCTMYAVIMASRCGAEACWNPELDERTILLFPAWRIFLCRATYRRVSVIGQRTSSIHLLRFPRLGRSLRATSPELVIK